MPRFGVLLLYKMNELKGDYEDVSFGASHLADSSVPPELIRAGFEAAVDHLQTHFGRIDPAWGDVNRLRRGDVDLPVGGGPDTLGHFMDNWGKTAVLKGTMVMGIS